MTEDAIQERDETTVEDQVEETGAIEDELDEPIEGEAGSKEAPRRSRLRETPEEKESRIMDQRLSQAKEVAAELRHKRGCPDEGKLPGEGGSRVEHFASTRPATSNTPEEPMLVIRCSRCGEAEVVPDESEA